MHPPTRLVVPLLAAVLLLLPGEAVAQAEFTPFVGYFVGSDIDPDAVPRQFQDGLTWGARGGYMWGAFGLEGSFTQSSAADFELAGQQIDSRATYADLNVVVQAPLERIKPYGTAGLGLTRFRVSDIDAPTHTKLGYNFGGGVKVLMFSQPRGQWGFRFDVRDHVITLDTENMRPGFRDKLLLPSPSETTVHNVVTTFGAYFSF